MPKKKSPPKPTKPELDRKQLILPMDWVERINAQRGEVSFADFVRGAILDKIGAEGLSEMPGWGMGRWKKAEQ